MRNLLSLFSSSREKWLPMCLVVGMMAFAPLLDVGCAPTTTPQDSGAKDSGTQDTGTADTATGNDQGTQDTGTQDTGTQDTGTQDTGTQDTGTPDTGPKDTGTPDTGTPDAGPKDTGTPDKGTPETLIGDKTATGGITVSGSVGAPKLTGGLDPLADVDVCVYEKPGIKCVKSDSAGKFSISGVPGQEETGLVFSKKDHVPFILTITTTGKDQTIGAMLAVTPKGTLSGLSLLLGKQIDFSKGLIAGAITDDKGTGLPNATVAMDPTSGDGPFYMGDTGIPDKNNTTTKKPGQYIWFNVTPGNSVEISVTHPTNKKCSSTGWVGTKAGTAKIPVVAGHMVAAGITCAP